MAITVHIVDTTLRDGEQKAGIALKVGEKLHIARILDRLGIYQIEAGIPAMGGDEKKCVRKMRELGLKSRISAWNRLNMNDIRQSMDCDPEIIHISVPVSDLQIKSKLKKDRSWVIDTMRKCIAFCQSRGYETTVGLEDASRADCRFLLQIIANAFLEGVKRIRYADTVGILYRQRIFDEIVHIKKHVSVDIEMHAHNDLGMAVANSIAAVRGGAEFVDCTIGGLGERAGNCDYVGFITSARACLGLFEDMETEYMLEAQKEILSIIK